MKNLGVSHPQTWLLSHKSHQWNSLALKTLVELQMCWEISGWKTVVSVGSISPSFHQDLQEFLVDQGLGAVIQVLDFVGRPGSAGMDADHQQQPAGWEKSTSFFRLKRSHKILDFLVEHDPIFDELAYFEKLGWVKHHQLVFWSESHTDASYQLPVPLLQGDFFFAKILVSLVGSFWIQGIASSGAPRTWAQKWADSSNTWREWGDIHLTDGWIVCKQLLYPLVSLDLREDIGFVAGR